MPIDWSISFFKLKGAIRLTSDIRYVAWRETGSRQNTSSLNQLFIIHLAIESIEILDRPNPSCTRTENLMCRAKSWIYPPESLEYNELLYTWIRTYTKLHFHLG